jgi:sterol desaturase/sphingolipid hydroxylase (fatty acid hydroxylase superfamily)
MMDYTLYLWHVLTHRIPFFWRFHAVHHVDLDLDASTALRFHFGEIAVSVTYRTAQVVLIGVDTEALTCADVSFVINLVSSFQRASASQWIVILFAFRHWIYWQYHRLAGR